MIPNKFSSQLQAAGSYKTLYCVSMISLGLFASPCAALCFIRLFYSLLLYLPRQFSEQCLMLSANSLPLRCPINSLEILAAKADTEHVAIYLPNNNGRFLKANYVEAVTFAAGPRHVLSLRSMQVQKVVTATTGLRMRERFLQCSMETARCPNPRA